MRLVVPEYYKEFRCIAGECQDSCCAGWDVDVDEEAQEYYKTVQGEFGKRLKDSTIIDEEGIRFQLCPNMHCCFLNDHLLCDLFTALGEEHLCVTCTEFPRYYEVFGALKEKGVGLSCPTAAKLIMEHTGPVAFVEEEIDEPIECNDLDYDLYMGLMQGRRMMFDLLSNEEIPFLTRLETLLLVANELQKCMDSRTYRKIPKVLEKFTNTKYATKQIGKSVKHGLRYVDPVANMQEMLFYFKELELVNRTWPRRLNLSLLGTNFAGMEDRDYALLWKEHWKEHENAYQQILTYYIYRYWMKAAYDEDLIAKVKFSLISTMMIGIVDRGQWFTSLAGLSEVPFEDEEEQLQRSTYDTPKYRKDPSIYEWEDFVWDAHLYSKEVEHSEENMEGIARACHEEEMFHVESILVTMEALFYE